MLVKSQITWIHYILKLLQDQVFPNLNRPCASHHWNTSILQNIYRFICCKILNFYGFLWQNWPWPLRAIFWITALVLKWLISGGMVFLGARHMFPYIADPVAYDGIFIINFYPAVFLLFQLLHQATEYSQNLRAPGRNINIHTCQVLYQ